MGMEGVASDDPVKVYLKEIGRVPLLASEERCIRDRHAPFEVVSKLDVYMAYKGFKAFFDEK